MIKPCIKCGAMDRYKRGDCAPCSRVAANNYRKANPEKKKSYIANWHKANSEQRKSYSANWRKANIEKVRISNANYRKANPEKVRLTRSNYRKSNIEKIRNAEANRYKANPEKSKSRIDKWKKANIEKVRISNTNYRKANPEKVRLTNSNYRKANLELYRAYAHNRRALKKNNGGKLSPDLAKTLYEKQKGKCICCKQSLGKDYHLDHIMPLALGGKNEDWNMQLLKAGCNMSKGAKHPVEYMQSRGLLL